MRASRWRFLRFHRALAWGAMLGTAGLSLGCGHTWISDDQLRMEEQNRRVMEDRITRLQAELRQSKVEKEQAASEVKKNQEEVDLRLEEVALQLRLIQGNIEKGASHREETVQQVEASTSRQAQKVEGLRSDIQAQIDALRNVMGEIQKTLAEQVPQIAALPSAVTLLRENTLSALGAHAARMDEIEGQVQKTRGADTAQVNKKLDQFSKTMDTLGQKLAEKVEQQEQTLRKAVKRLDTLERKAGAR